MTFILIPLFLVLNVAVINLGPWSSHEISAFFADIDNISPTPLLWAASLSLFPEYNKSWPVDSLCCPAKFHLVSLIPKMSMLFVPAVLPLEILYLFRTWSLRSMRRSWWSWSTDDLSAWWLPNGFHHPASWMLPQVRRRLPGQGFGLFFLLTFL